MNKLISIPYQTEGLGDDAKQQDGD